MSHDKLTDKYNITTPFQILSTTPKLWKNKIKTLPINKENIPASNSINVNNKILNIEKTKCKDFCWHLINKFSYTPNNILKWCETYPDFNNADLKTWPRILKIALSSNKRDKNSNISI